MPISDLLAGMYGAYGVVAKLHERARTGLGGLVRTSLLASVVGVHAYQGTRWTVAGEIPKAEGPHHPSICPYGLFHSARRHRADRGRFGGPVGSGSRRRSTCRWMRPDFATNADRVRNAAVVRAAVEQAFAAYTTADLLAKLSEIGVPSGEVKNLQQVFEWDQTRSQGLLIDVEHPVLGRDPAARAAAALLRRRRRRVAPRAHRSADCWASTPTRCWPGWRRNRRPDAARRSLGSARPGSADQSNPQATEVPEMPALAQPGRDLRLPKAHFRRRFVRFRGFWISATHGGRPARHRAPARPGSS